MFYQQSTVLAAVLAVYLLGSVMGRSQSSALPPSGSALGDLTLEQLLDVKVESVYGASKFEQKVTQAPSSVSIVTSDEIDKYGHRNLADVLRSVPGIFVTDDGNYSYVGVRGFNRPGDYNSRVLLLIDGHRLNDNNFAATYFGNEGILDVDLIDRVEVIRGPSSSIYGDSAFFAVINVRTKRAPEFGHGEVSAEAGSFDTYKGRLTLGRTFKNDVELLVSGSFYDSRGDENLRFREFNTPAMNHGVAEDSDAERAYNLFGSVRYHDFTLSGAYNYRSKYVPTASFGTVFNDGRERTIDERAYVDLKFERDLTESTRLTARVAYDAYPYLGIYPYDYAAPGDPPNIVLNKDEAIGDWLSTEVQVTQRIWERHTLLVGAEYRENIRQEIVNYDAAPRAVYVDVAESGRDFGVYGQAEIAVLTNLLWNGGVRYDHYDTFGSTVNPRVGLIYSPWEKSTFKALFGQAFRGPSNYERLYGALEIESKPNPNLQPETLRMYELVWEQQLPRRHSFSLSAYHYDIEDLITQVIDPVDNVPIFKNVDEVTANGVELQAEGRYEWLTFRASHAVQRATDSRTGDELSNSPRHLTKVNATVPLYRDKLYAGLEIQYNAEVKTVRPGHASDFVVANVNLFSRNLVKGLELSAGIYNLFDSRYGYPGSHDHLQRVLPQDGRSFRVKLTYKF